MNLVLFILEAKSSTFELFFSSLKKTSPCILKIIYGVRITTCVKITRHIKNINTQHQ